MTDRWNHNVHYGRQLLSLVPLGAHDVLDIGCGEGWLVRELRQRVPHVVGIDADRLSIAAAAASDMQEGIEYLQGDFLTWPFKPASFDMVTAVASLHHLDEDTALGRAAVLLRPRGVLAVVGIARSRSIRDFAFDIAGVAATRVQRRSKGTGKRPHRRCGLRRTPTMSCGASQSLPSPAASTAAARCSATSSRGQSRTFNRLASPGALCPACRRHPACVSEAVP